MKRSRKLLIGGLVAVLPVLLVGEIVLYFWLSLRHVPLAAWVERVRRPGYHLLYSKETSDHSYYAIFDASDDRLALCELEGRATNQIRMSTTSITTLDGKDALDTTRAGRPLLRNLLGVYTVMDGYEEAIKPGIAGRLKVRHEVGHEEAAIDTEIDWRTPAQP